MKFFRSSAVLLLLIVPCLAYAKIDEAEVVWVGVEGDENSILYNRYFDGKWSTDPVTAYHTKKSIITPFITTNEDGTKTLFWSESSGELNMVLMIMHGKVVNSDSHRIAWSTPGKFSDLHDYNAGAVAIIDLNGNPWVLWTAENDSDSDIFYSTKRDSSWSAPQMLHPDNNVPDLQPMLQLNSDGELEASWLSYSFADNRYVSLKKTITPTRYTPSNPAPILEPKPSISENFATPGFLPIQQQLIRIHYPGNKMQQYENLGTSTATK